MKQYFFPLTHSVVLFSNTSLSCRLQLVHVYVQSQMHTHGHFYTHWSQTGCFYIMAPAEVFGSYYKAGAFTHLSTCFTPCTVFVSATFSHFVNFYLTNSMAQGS